MAIDLSVFGKIKTKEDYDRASQEFAMKQQAAQQKAAGGDLPAALQLANEYQKARVSGDTQRMNDISVFAKALDKGLLQGADGTIQEMPGYGTAVGGIAGAKAGQSEQAKKDVQLNMNPQIAEVVEEKKVLGKERGENKGDLNAQVATLPQLEDAVKELSALGQNATYTKTGQLADAVVRETGPMTGVESTEGARNRTEYMAKVDNQILPLLRRTFGAQFTVQEGESLRATLGDPNKSPQEKDAALRAFIETKRANIASKAREVGGGMPPITQGQLEAPAGQSPAMPPSLTPTTLVPVMGGLAGQKADFNARKKFTPEQIQEYKRMKGMQ